MPIAELLQHRCNGVGRVADLPVEANIAPSSVIRYGDGNRLLVDIETEIGVKIHLVRLPVHEGRRRIGATLVQ